MEERSYFKINAVRSTLRRTTFVLDGYKQGCNKIWFYGGESDLKSILINIFNAGRSFDFTIAEASPATEECTIKEVIQVSG